MGHDKRLWFLSFKWKLLLSILLLLLAVGFLLGWFAFKQLSKQQGQLLAEQEFRLKQNLKNTLTNQIDINLDMAQQLRFFILEHQFNELTPDLYQALLDQYWTGLQHIWNVRSLRLYRDQTLLANVGQAPSHADQDWLTHQIKQPNPHHRVMCDKTCFFQVLVPVVIQGQVLGIVFERELIDILNRFRGDEAFEFAVFSEPLSYQTTANYWGRQLHVASHEVFSFQLIEEAERDWRWEDVIKDDGIYTLAGTPWALWVFSLDDRPSGMVLVVMYDLEDWQAVLKTFQQSMLGILLLSLLLTGVLVTLMAWSPMRRLSHNAKMLPMLAEQKFDEFRCALPKTVSGLLDEVDLINFASHKLANQLQSLAAKVEVKTLELERLSMLDPLTGLPNKAVLLHELHKAIACIGRLHNQLALLFLDLDEFKRINDTLGHSEGDALLRIIAGRLSNCVRDMDTVFRQGGDEFLILLRGVREEQDLPIVIHKIFSSLQQPIVLGNHKLIVTTSIGVAMCHSPNLPAEELIKQADLAMYRAKEAGRSNYRIFTSEMSKKANNRLMIEQDIGAAIAEHQLSLFLQPIVALPDGRLKGFEALIRWFHPERGLIMPGNFIPDIEQSDAIILVGNYVLEQGASLLARLRAEGWDNIYLAVNLSAKHYLTAGLVEFIQQLLDKYELPASSLLLEVTEESVIEQVDQAMVMMHELKKLGVRIAIDDFGTGYSSLSYLKRLPFDVLKIDRFFTHGMLENSVDSHIVTTVIDLAHNLQRTVVAEGIETQEQCDFLASAGCELAQGYLFDKPHNEAHIFRVLSQIQSHQIWPKADPHAVYGKLGS